MFKNFIIHNIIIQNFQEKIQTFWGKNIKPTFFTQYQKLKPIQNALMETFSLQDVQPVTEQFIYNQMNSSSQAQQCFHYYIPQGET